MKTPLLLLFAALALAAPRAFAGDEAVKGGARTARAMRYVNGAEAKTILDGDDVPGPGARRRGDALVRGVRTAQGALYGAVAGAVIGGGIGLFGGPAGVFGGAAGGAQLGAMAGMALGAGLCFLLGGKAGSGKPGAIEKSQNDLDDALKQL
ncbi:MAG: hypothetical protein KGL74_14765 [Elusimicrobia bacterium]|nr:hypothetical protein [Elusimicrobiota bacterium]